jgi:hypothetical protein
MDRWWNDADRGKLKYWEKNLSQCHFPHHKSHMGWLESKCGPLLWDTSSWQSELWHDPGECLAWLRDRVNLLWCMLHLPLTWLVDYCLSLAIGVWLFYSFASIYAKVLSSYLYSDLATIYCINEIDTTHFLNMINMYWMTCAVISWHTSGMFNERVVHTQGRLRTAVFLCGCYKKWILLGWFLSRFSVRDVTILLWHMWHDTLLIDLSYVTLLQQLSYWEKQNGIYRNCTCSLYLRNRYRYPPADVNFLLMWFHMNSYNLGFFFFSEE